MSESKVFDLYSVLIVTHHMPAQLDQYRNTVGTELTISPVPEEWWR